MAQNEKNAHELGSTSTGGTGGTGGTAGHTTRKDANGQTSNGNAGTNTNAAGILQTKVLELLPNPDNYRAMNLEKARLAKKRKAELQLEETTPKAARTNDESVQPPDQFPPNVQTTDYASCPDLGDGSSNDPRAAFKNSEFYHMGKLVLASGILAGVGTVLTFFLGKKVDKTAETEKNDVASSVNKWMR
jgi:hypothetical protein